LSDDNPNVSGLAALVLAAAQETAEAEDAHAQLPRLLRYALADEDRHPFLRERLVREILEVAPDLQNLAEAWLNEPSKFTVALAAALETRSVHADSPDFVALAMCARLLGLNDGYQWTDEHRKVAAAIAATAEAAWRKMSDGERAQLDKLVIGWAIVTAGIEVFATGRASEAAYYASRERLKHIVGAAVDAERRAQKKVVEDLKPAAAAADNEADSELRQKDPPGFVRVCVLSDEDAQSKKIVDLIKPFQHVIGVAVPLAPTPDLKIVRATLAREFPYARAVVDTIIQDLVGKEYVKLRPTLLLGSPGGGKSRFMRRVADLMGAGSWRVDGSSSDGAVIGGTARRWHTSEPCHPFQAIVRARVANPLVLIDEVDKASTRSDYGRLWDTLLALLESETAQQYPDPALLTNVDLSHVSYLATANAVEPLPQPLRDRVRVLAFPTPTRDDLTALLPPLLDAYGAERGLDVRWLEPFSPEEIEAVASRWPGGSVRRLGRLVEAVLQAREKAAARH